MKTTDILSNSKHFSFDILGKVIKDILLVNILKKGLKIKKRKRSIFILSGKCAQWSEFSNIKVKPFFNQTHFIHPLFFPVWGIMYDSQFKIVTQKLWTGNSFLKLWPNRVWLLSLMLSIYQYPSVTLFVFKGFMHLMPHGTEKGNKNISK